MEEQAKYEVATMERPLTAVQVRAQVNLIQEVMKSVMQKDQHYGVIPGAGNKPTLLKPGAEKLMLTFRLSPDPIVEDLSNIDERRYRITCRINDRDGHFLGSGLGEASSNEEKYKWRAAVCKEEFEETPEDRRRVKWRKGYQGGAATKTQQVRMEPADIANTILKMAKKRALVDAALTVTAASDIFTQDLEELPKEYLDRHQETPPAKVYNVPPKVAAPPPAADPNLPCDDVPDFPGDNLSEPGTERLISDPQAKRLFAIAKGAGWTNEVLKEYLVAAYQIDSTKKIPLSKYEAIIERLQKGM